MSWRLSNTEPFGEWLRQGDLDQPIQWPSFNRTIGGAYSPGAIQIGATAPSNIGVVEGTIFDDQPTYLLTYDYLAPSTEGPFPVEVKEWIAKDTFWLLKQEVWQNDPFGFTGTKTRVFTDHNKPVDIPCADFVETSGE